MRTPSYTRYFAKDMKLVKKRGKDTDKIRKVITWILEDKPLDARLRDHKLSGNYADHRECHIEPDWLLIYKLEPGIAIFVRTGTHSDLFR